ncbi:MAG: hypothetical protein Q4A28_06430 [Brachymonas sp.]|nr:hypothetical protein [Brachymonas sp.]
MPPIRSARIGRTGEQQSFTAHTASKSMVRCPNRKPNQLALESQCALLHHKFNQTIDLHKIHVRSWLMFVADFAQTRPRCFGTKPKGAP